MNTKSILFTSCVAAMTLSVSVAMAGPHGGSAGGGFSGGGFRGGGGGFRGGSAPARMTPGFAGAGSRFGPGMSRNFRDFGGDRDRFHHRHFNEFVFFGDFGDPFFIRTTMDIIPTAITPTGIVLMAMDPILTINPFTRASRPAGVPRLPKSSSVSRVQAITGAGSTESWVLEPVMQSELTNARTIRA